MSETGTEIAEAGNQLPATQNDQFMAVIERIAANPEADVTKLEKMLDMQERVMAKNAEIEFNEAMARLQTKIPVIKRSAKGHNSKYAKYEHIEAVVRPLYTEEGFSISYDSKNIGEGSVEYEGTISHKGGHKKTANMILPADTSGSKNSIQAIGSTVSYAKRYLLTMLLNIVTQDEDDDGFVGGNQPINEKQIEEIRTLLDDTGTDVMRFCLEYAKVDSLNVIPASHFEKCKQALIAKKRKQEQEAQNADNS